MQLMQRAGGSIAAFRLDRVPSLGLLVLLLLFSYGVLIHELDETPLWSDEGWTIAASADSPDAIVNDWLARDVHPPLYFLLLHGWRQFVGDTIFELRYFAVLITLSGAAVMYRLGKALFGFNAGVLALLFFALHDLVLVLTQEVRHYSLQLTLTALAIWFYWRFWQHPNRRRALVFAISGAALLWAHYWGGFILFGLACHALITRRKQTMPFVLAYAGVGVLFIPWLPILYKQITLERPDGLPHALENSWIVYKTLVYQLVGVPEAFWFILAGVGTLGTFTGAFKKLIPSAASILPALLVLVTVGFSLALNARYPTLSFRSLAVIIPPLSLAIAHAMAQFRPREQTIIVIFFIIHALTTLAAQPVLRAPWEEVSQFLTDHTTADETILLEMSYDDHALVYYIDHHDPAVEYAYTETERERWNDPAKFNAYLSEVLAERDGVWLAKLDWFFFDIRPALLEQGFVATAEPVTWSPYAGDPIEMWRFDRLPSGDAQAVFDDNLNLMRFSSRIHDGEITVNTLWTVEEKPTISYTFSTFLLDANGFPTGKQKDAFPMENRASTLDWEASQFYFDSRVFSIEGLPAGRYQLGLKVYEFRNNFTEIRVAPSSDCSATANCEYIILESIEIR